MTHIQADEKNISCERYTLPIRNWYDILGTMSVYISMRNIVITGDSSIYRILIG